MSYIQSISSIISSMKLMGKCAKFFTWAYVIFTGQAVHKAASGG